MKFVDDRSHQCTVWFLPSALPLPVSSHPKVNTWKTIHFWRASLGKQGWLFQTNESKDRPFTLHETSPCLGKKYRPFTLKFWSFQAASNSSTSSALPSFKRRTCRSLTDRLIKTRNVNNGREPRQGTKEGEKERKRLLELLAWQG